MKTAIFGCGKVGKRLLKLPLKNENSIVLVTDNNKEIWGKEICGYKISSPEKLIEVEYDVILIALVHGAEEVKEQILNMGISEDKIRYHYGLEAIDYLNTPLDDIFDVAKKELIPFSKGPAIIYRDYTGETIKSHARRMREEFFDKYCRGEGIDIGYGADLIVPKCSGWDVRNGDAEYLVGVEDESFDFAYSSHCLEHMANVRTALKNWFRVVRPGGFLIIAVPHRDLYEKKKTLPSRFNGDHKHMFLIGKAEPPDTLDIIEEIRATLDNYDIKYVKTCDEGHTISDPLLPSDGEYQIEIVIQKLPSL